MKETIHVQMTEDTLFDFMLYHTYSKFSGFLINILGVTVVLLGIFMRFIDKISIVQLIYYVLAGILFLIFTPVQLKLRAKKYIKSMPEYQMPKEYTFSDEGILVVQGNEQKYVWKDICKIVAAPKTFGFYYGENDALIIPKLAFGEQYMPIMKIVTLCVNRDRIKLR